MSAPFDVGAVIRQVRFAYRPEAGAWRGGHSTYEVRASAESLTLTPFHDAGTKGAPLRLGAASMARGARALGGATAHGRVEQDGHLTLSRADAITEHLRNGEDGIEQSWTFERAPEGEGELRVRIPVEGLSFIGVTPGGLHFADPQTGLGFRYGHATWVDGAGRKTGLKAAYASGHILLRVPSSLLASSEYPAVLDPIISPELGMDSPVVGLAAGTQAYPALASNGTDYLVVWQDSRTGTKQDVYGTRVTSAGAVLDPQGLHIGTGAGEQSFPVVASNGTDWLVVWEDQPAGGGTWDIKGARVSGAGVVLDPEALSISAEAGSQTRTAVASNGTDYLVVWQDSRSPTSPDIYGARVTSAGAVLDPTGVPLSTDVNGQVAPAVSSNGTDWLVAWEDTRNATSYRDIYGTRVSATGAVLDPAGLPISTSSWNQNAPAVASNGTGYLVVWTDSRNSGSGQDVYGARVTDAGAVLDPAGLPVRAANGSQSSPVVASNGTDYLVTWADTLPGSVADVHGARVTSAGQVLDTSPLIFSATASDERTPAVAAQDGNYLVVWADTRNDVRDIYGTRVTGTGAVLDPAGLGISLEHNQQSVPAVASNGTDYLVVWQDWRNPRTPDIYGARVSRAGVVLDPAGLLIHASANELRAPAVASNGTDWFVVWEDSGPQVRIKGTRVTSAGEVLDPSGLPLCTATGAQRAPKVTSLGSGYFVVWADSRGGLSRIYGARVLDSGTVLDPAGLAIGTASSNQSTPAVASNETGYLVVWRQDSGAFADLYGSRVADTGAVLDTTPLALSTATGGQYAPAVASDGTDYLVVWDDSRTLGHMDVYGTQVTNAGAVVHPAGLALATGTPTQRLPAVVFDGENYLVIWESLVSGTHHPDLQGLRVTRTGTLLEPDGILLSQGSLGASAVSVASAGGQSSLIVYQSLLDHAQRVAGRLVSFAHLTLTAPNGGEQWESGSSQAITWTASGISQVKLEYSTDDGATWALIADGVDASTGSYAWTVPAQASTTARVRVSESVAGMPADVSDGTFSLLVPAKVILNEILANEPGSSTTGEFVELVNAGGAAIDISGWTVSDATAVRHTFAAGTVLGAGKAIVVYGGASAIPPGTPNAVASTTGTLSLANAADSVTVKDASGTVMDTFSYTSALSGTDGVSMNRSPDASTTGGFVLHTALSALSSSGGARVDGSAF